MIWALLFKSVFEKDHATFFLTTSLKENVKTYVLEKERSKEIIVKMKVSKKEQEVFKTERKRFVKVSGKLNFDWNSTKKQYVDLMDEYLEICREIQVFSIDNEIAMKKITTEEEWGNIMNAILEKTIKNKTKNRMESHGRNFFDRLALTCRSNIEDASIRSWVIATIGDFRNKVNKTIAPISELSYQNLETIRSYHAECLGFKPVLKPN